MNKKQKIAIVTPLILVVFMYPVFQLLAAVFDDNWRIGWFIGLLIYWLIWGMVFPLLIIGKENILKLIKPQKLNTKIFFLILVPLLIVVINKFILVMEYEKPSVLILILLLSTTFGNGLFEEILWRGVYMKLFPDSILFRIVWPSICFGLWHYAPGSVAPDGHVLVLMIGAVFFGFYLSFLAKKTETLWWSIVVHTLFGIIMVL